MKKRECYVVVTGGVLSGLGKGLFVSSLGTLLKSKGFNVVPIKIDPYVNVDAGTMNPMEHGEVFVLDDGSEVDMDLGNYERFLDLTLTSKSNITTGKIFKQIIEKERRGDFLGKTVQLIPHVTAELKEWYKNIAKESGADIILIEIGGTIGDIENQVFLESVRELSLEEKVMFIHCTLVPVIGVVGEQKTKPAQQSVRILREIGVIPNMIFCRSEEEILDSIKEKISKFCGVKKEFVISGPDLKNIYEIPLILEKQAVADKVANYFGFESSESQMEMWKKFVHSMNNPINEITIAITGKYTYLKDAYISVIESLYHAGGNLKCNIKLRWIETTDITDENEIRNLLKDIDGILVPGGFGSRGTEGKMLFIKYARENNIPFLGLCYGFQLAVIEFARNVCNIEDANSTEIKIDCKNPVITIMEEQKNIIKKGGTMRLGKYPAILKKNSLVHKLYGEEKIFERHRHRYEVNNDYKTILENNGMVFSGMSPNNMLVEFLEFPKHRFFVATQAHPEFTSRPLKPNPIFIGFVKACLDSQSFFRETGKNSDYSKIQKINFSFNM
ncbi:MAG: CTP synthase (glutamine hydrolyzing) [Candidatus Pacearchaeota archaeon]